MQKRNRGQGLVEYLILVCLLAVATIAVVSVVGQNIRARYANISAALQGKRGREKMEAVESDSYELRGFDDFMESGNKQGGK
ncbi:MAG: hypothetical protein H6617_09935 [Bdellovibrionaceae bacterium]|nr:hypothetical protein [Bdellovibrionales bacterium]MCB9254989.1 hypothetical protein [Pseudobdellovibrionaceae bacterium]